MIRHACTCMDCHEDLVRALQTLRTAVYYHLLGKDNESALRDGFKLATHALTKHGLPLQGADLRVPS
jgi:hypothetical protein